MLKIIITFVSMKRSILYSISFILAIALFSSVASAHPSFGTYHKYVKEYVVKADVSKNASVSKGTDFSPFTMDLFYVDYNKVITHDSYRQGKLNNKALPLSRKIWLLNCQIALK